MQQLIQNMFYPLHQKKDNDTFEKTFFIELANGKKYFYTESRPNGEVPDFVDIVSKNLNSNKTYKIDTELKRAVKPKCNK